VTGDPIAYLAGGPGAAVGLDAESIAAWRAFLAQSPWLAGRDVILFDQRGAGFAVPSLDCPEYRVVAADWDAIGPQSEAIATCRRRLRADGIKIQAYSTASLTEDLIDLREALWIDRWYLWGNSYGSRVALEAMRQDPEGLSGVILDGVHPPDAGSPADDVRHLGASLDRLFDDCAADAGCASAYPNLEERFERLIARFDKSPVALGVKPTRDSQLRRIGFDDAFLFELILNDLATAEGISELPRTFHGLSNGDWAVLEKLYVRWAESTLDPRLTLGANLSVGCKDGRGASAPQFWSAVRHYMSGWAGHMWNRRRCKVWGWSLHPSVSREPVASDVPALLLSGSYDYATPARYARSAAKSLSRGYAFEFPDRGHDASEDPCARRLIAQFLERPEQQPHDICLTRLRPPKFVLPDD
jgi:pimeloyl-ACP methyl ester carboxylesterase